MYITENDIMFDKKDSYVEIVLPSGDKPWEGGINGKFYRISRGKPVKVPQNLATLIRLNEQVTVINERIVGEYKRGKGKCLGGDGV